MEFYGDSPQYVIRPSGGAVLADFTSRVNKIVVASIDRYLWGEGFQKCKSLGYYEKTRSGNIGERENYLRVSVPNADGSGGGVVDSYGHFYYSEANHNYAADFQKIRNNVLHEFAPLKSLPVVAEIDSVAEKIDAVRNDLSVEVTSSSYRTTGVASSIKTIQSLQQLIRGGNYADFASYVTNRIPGVVDAIGSIVACMLSAVQAEKDAIVTFRNDLGNAMDQLAKELDGRGSSITLADVLAVVSWALGAASTIGTGGTTAIAKLAVDSVITVSTISYSASKQSATASGIGWGIDAGPKAVRELLVSRKADSSLSAALFDAEEQLGVFLNLTNKLVIGSPEPYDLHPYFMQGKASGMSVEDLDAVRSVAVDTFPALTDALRSSAKELAGISISTALSRSWEVGRGVSGIAPEYNQLNSFVVDALNALAEELDEVAYSLKKYVTDLENSEAESAAALTTAANDLHPKMPKVYSDQFYSEKRRHQ